MTQTDANVRGSELGETEPAPPSPSPARWTPWVVLVAGVLILTGVALFRLEALETGYLTFDPGIRYHLSQETLRGAVPIRDFEHGWNFGGWYVGAGLYWLVGGNPLLWDWLWEVVSGAVLAGTLGLVLLYRLRVPVGWQAAFLGIFLTVQTLPHGKYAIPTVWAVLLLPVGFGRRLGWGLALRAALGAVTLWLHVDLAIMLVAGTGLFDLFARRDARWRDRLLLAATPGLAALAALGVQAALYEVVFDYPARELLDFLLLERSNTIEGINFEYPLLRPQELVQLLYPASLLLPVVPAVWRRLGEPTRLVVLLHVSLSLTGLRKADVPHTQAAAALLALVVVLVAFDLWRNGGLQRRGDRRIGLGGLPWLVAGAGWFAAAVLVAFRVESLFAWPAFLALVAATILVADRPHPVTPSRSRAFGLGAAAAAAALIVGGAAGHVIDEVDQEQDPQARILAEELREAGIDHCLEPGREALVIRHPLGLYDELDLDNPTPFYLFWDGFRAEFERFTSLANAGDIPTVIQVNGWSPGLRSIGPWIENTYVPCLEIEVPETENRVRVWTYPSADAAIIRQ